MTEKPAGAAPDPGSGDKPPLNKWIGVGLGAGIGSAAVAAALLYAGARKGGKDKRSS